MRHARSWAPERTLCQPVGPLVDWRVQGCKCDRSVLQRSQRLAAVAPWRARLASPAVGFARQDRKPDRALGGSGTSVCSAAMVELETSRTKTDSAGPNGWNISDEVTRLREWGTDIVYPLPSRRETSIIGSAGDCWLRLWDPTGRI